MTARVLTGQPCGFVEEAWASDSSVLAVPLDKPFSFTGREKTGCFEVPALAEGRTSVFTRCNGYQGEPSAL